MVAMDGLFVIKNVAFESSKLHLFRCATINDGENMQVLNVAICARPEYDLPIFCADFFSTPRMSIVVLDLNPLYNTDQRPDYKAKYFSRLFPLGNKYELLPWGDKLTAESIQFFSPIVVWTRPGNRDDIEGTVFSAFKEYLAAHLHTLKCRENGNTPKHKLEESIYSTKIVVGTTRSKRLIIIWWAGLMRGAKSIALAFNQSTMLQKDISRIMQKSGKDLGVRALLIGVALLLRVLRVDSDLRD